MDDFLLEYQYQSESPLFQFLYQRKKDNKEFTIEEQQYFNHYKYTFLLEAGTAFVLMPSTFMAYRLMQEFKSSKGASLKFQRYCQLTGIFGIPGVAIYGYSLYRRFITKAPYQKELEDKYLNELKPKLKIIDSSKKE
ncbi:unnamed protein product (macronuclear) [Paramecium tetraurelia]|uniref:Transmembrane protein n=1 Tax=Paramecium tetraurelia TaxID=5888 RepID=A0BKP6_PARTE|nr:uncharacterized protein GSPATT00029744001 [Paramecium tetraurelia]CAK59113.1 unnamed protein product [Paramecium tetraurelia]|eukprot:XP_001426511.1 hypothetical protein (macronuclear) [Paramecium tetraurelia strain d4-2]